MALTDYINKPGFVPFIVICKDSTMIATDITEGCAYVVLGVLQGYFIMKNDKQQLGKYYRDRFQLEEE